jgi:hypothetical protein
MMKIHWKKREIQFQTHIFSLLKEEIVLVNQASPIGLS